MINFASGYIKYIHHLEAINDAALLKPNSMIKQVEESYHDNLKEIARNIIKHDFPVKICMLAGPSSSGKTTTSHCLQACMNELGRNTYIVSLDDFYLNKSEIPVLPSGIKDFDTVEALDISAIKECMSKIIATGEIVIPNYCFVEGTKVGEPTVINVKEDDLVIIEGIHALNPMFTMGLSEDNIVKLYVSVKQPISDANGVVIFPDDIRLVRRIVRDVQFRGCQPEDTLAMWDMVEAGDTKFIRPYRFTADYTVNSIHLYELCVLRTMSIPMLRAIERNSPFFRKARDLEAKLMRFEPIPPELVPDNSILREFIGSKK